MLSIELLHVDTNQLLSKKSRKFMIYIFFYFCDIHIARYIFSSATSDDSELKYQDKYHLQLHISAGRQAKYNNCRYVQAEIITP